MRNDRWTAEQLQLARDLRARHAHASEYVALIGRSKASAFSRMYTVDNEERDGISRHARERAASDAKHPVVKLKYVPDDVIMEAQRRHSAPQTLTGLIFGDPPIGYRAIDRKREQESA